MATTAEWRRGLAVLVVALWALVPARPVFAQVTSTSAPAVTSTTTTTVVVTTTTTSTSTTTTVAPDFPIADPFDPDASDVTTGPPVTGVTIPVTVTTEVTLPFSRPFSTSTSTTADAAPTTTADSSTTVLTTTTTTALTESLRVVAEPAPVPRSPEEHTGSRTWIVLAGASLVLLAGLGARRLRG